MHMGSKHASRFSVELHRTKRAPNNLVFLCLHDAASARGTGNPVNSSINTNPTHSLRMYNCLNKYNHKFEQL